MRSTAGGGAGASGGKQDAATTGRGYRDGMAPFSIIKGGLMYEAALRGAKFSYDPL